MERLEVKNFDKNFGVYLVINTTECESWAVEGDKPLIHVVRSAEEFMNLGLEVSTDGRPFTDLKVGEKVSDYEFGGDYEGVYVMRVG
jgi:hypothetical protein